VEILIGHTSEEMLAESVGDCRSVGLVQGAMAIGFQRNQIPGGGSGKDRSDKAENWSLVFQWFHSEKGLLGLTKMMAITGFTRMTHHFLT